jgi:hypothetical protein
MDNQVSLGRAAESPKAEGNEEEANEVFVAFAAFAARGEHELGLEANEAIEVFNRENPKWWYGRKADGTEVRLGEKGREGGREGGWQGRVGLSNQRAWC